MQRVIWQRLKNYMESCMQDSAHDRAHVIRVMHNAAEIAQAETDVNVDVLMTAALLHDIGRADEMAHPGLDHAVIGGDKAYAALLEMGFSLEFAEHVRQCIRTHRFRRSDPPASVEARILFDADKLDVCGAIGVARTLMYSGEHHRPIYTTAPDGTILDGSGEEADSFFREYRYKLEGMYGRFLTKRGEMLAAARQRAAADFYAALLTEVQGTGSIASLDELVEW